jgi:hypothetical protein
MPKVRSAISIAFAACTICYAAPPCAVTEAPSHVFVAPPPYGASPGEGEFYFGSDDFWTILPGNGVWETQHDQPTYDRRKIVWFSKDYWWLSRQESDLTVDARKLSGSAESVHGGRATNAFIPEHQTSAMMNSIEFRSTGCWEISARWHDHELKFVDWVTPYTASSN